MNNNNEINKWVDDALNSLNDVERATGKPYLLTRLNSKMQRNTSTSSWDKALQFISKPTVAIACMFLIIAFNALVLSKNYNNTATTADEQYAAVDEYNTNITTLNYTENIEP